MDYKKRYEQWLKEEIFDEATKNELRAIEGDEKEIEDRFYKDLEFGTAGLRGVIGAGINRMNPYTVRRATQGLANYIIKSGNASKSVSIAYDSRHMSVEFANEAALCLAANGIKAYVFDSLRPTPELSFAIRHLKSIAGINITASHNPPEYNGYKVYWEDGAQITPPHDEGIMSEVLSIDDFSKTKTMDKQAAIEKGLYEVIDKAVDDAYIDEIKKLVIHKDAIDAFGDKLVIVYSPLHGTGNVPVNRILKELGFKNVYTVPQQEKPDGDFPTVSYPNPEAKEAFELGLALAKEKNADLVLATDPDADRLGVYVKDGSGEYHCLTGNMSGCLIGDYIIGQRKAKGDLPSDGAFIKSIVSTNLADEIAAYYGVELIEVLTGFKYIGQKMLEFENQHNGTYLFGMEESYGCLPGTYARDKDAVAATMILCEAAAYYMSIGKTLWDAMNDLYDRHGFIEDEVISVTLAGKAGLEQIAAIMSSLRENEPREINGLKVVNIRDYKSGKIKGFPKSNVLYYELEAGAWVCIRPSGTEPKIKLYYGIKMPTNNEAKKTSEDMKNYLKNWVEKLKNA